MCRTFYVSGPDKFRVSQRNKCQTVTTFLYWDMTHFLFQNHRLWGKKKCQLHLRSKAGEGNENKSS